MRKNLYLSERRQKDVIEYLRQYADGDWSYEVVELLRDGIKWRGRGNHVANAKTNTPLDKVLSSREHTESMMPDFSEVVLSTKVLSPEEVTAKLTGL